MLRRALALLLFAGASACSQGSSLVVETLHLTTGDFQVPAGTEQLKCVYVDMPSDQDFLVVGLRIHAPPGLHHFILFYSDPSQPAVVAAPRGQLTDCVDPAAVPIGGTLGAGISLNEEFPRGLAIRIPKGSVLRMTEHSVNASLGALPGRVDVELDRGRAADLEHVLGLYYNELVNFDIEPQAHVRLSGSCPVDDGAQLVLLSSHMHRHGEKFLIGLSDNASGATQPLYESDSWSDPLIQRSMTSPIAVPPGSSLEWSCDFLNRDTYALHWGQDAEMQEMCLMVALYWPDSGRPRCTVDAQVQSLPPAPP
jgi:hypothetical protein